ncbi:MAG TPA: efflux RND transporter permease subunit, partial [Burkholderiaceae bacterium]|nr:efflux RND transporter permease subunit [Burkholderiaceae bacterium]
ALPAVRIALDPNRLAAQGLALEDIRVVVTAANANRPKGLLDDGSRTWQITANDQARTAVDYAPLIVRYKNGSALRLSDVAQVVDSVQDSRNYGVANGQPAILLMLFKAPGANIIESVDKVRALLPQLQASIPPAIALNVVSDRSPTIRASLREVENALALSVGLVILVVFLFLRNGRAAVIPSVAVPVSLAGTFCVMYLCGYTLDNLSLMALTVATGFVVDDAIVVLENIARHMERGKTALQAARDGAREIGFTVVSISLSLIAVFIPILLMGGIVGRLFREFAVVLSSAILVSMVVSLTTTPMMCAALLRTPARHNAAPSRLAKWSARVQAALLRGYRHSLAWGLRHPPVVLLFLAGVIGLNVYLYGAIEKGFFPTQDTGRIGGFIRADQATSFQAMQQRLDRFLAVVQADPAVVNVTGFTGGGQRNTAMMFMTLKPRSQREESAEQVIDRLRQKLAKEPGARLFMFQQQDIRIGGRQSSSSYQYTLQADNLEDLRQWEPRIRQALTKLPEITDVDTDRADSGLQTTLVYDRDAMARLGITVRNADNTLNNAFGQRQVGVIYNPLNQYRVVMELADEFLQGPDTLRSLHLMANGKAVPLASVSRNLLTVAPLSVNHQSGTPASTISFDLPLGGTLSAATDAITDAVAGVGVPVSVRGSFEGTAKGFKDSLGSQPVLIAAALLTIYLVLGILYESLIHPITILSTLPSAGVGALLALMAFKTEFSLIALIGVILLIGIVKKNAIMM